MKRAYPFSEPQHRKSDGRRFGEASASDLSHRANEIDAELPGARRQVEELQRRYSSGEHQLVQAMLMAEQHVKDLEAERERCVGDARILLARFRRS